MHPFEKQKNWPPSNWVYYYIFFCFAPLARWRSLSINVFTSLADLLSLYLVFAWPIGKQSIFQAPRGYTIPRGIIP